MRGLAATVAASALAGLVSACDGARETPARLADGTPAQVSDVEFEGVEVPVIATKVEAVRGRPPIACANTSRAVDRVGVAGASRTTRSDNARELRACDWTTSWRWCGSAFALVRDEQPLDPRLSITCRGADGEPVGFLWIHPGRDTSYVVVAGRGYAEAYATVRDAPVRLTTDRVELATSSATVDVSEHTLEGRLLRAQRIEAQVSG